MLTRADRTVVRHLETSRSDHQHALVSAQLSQFDEVAVIQTQVRQTAAVEVPHARVERPRQLGRVRRSADEQRRAEVEGAVVARGQALTVLLSVHSERHRPSRQLHHHVMLSTVVHAGSDEESLGAAAKVEQSVEVAVTQLHREEVRPSRTWTRHHQNPVTLDRLQLELHL